MTPREVFLTIQAAVYGLRRQHELTVWHAWHTAAFHRAKKMPSWSRVRPRYHDDAGKKKMGWKQQLAMVQAINYFLGGNDLRKHGQKNDSES